MKVGKFICTVLAGLFAIGIIGTLIVCTAAIAWFCNITFLTAFATVGAAFFIATYLLAGILLDADYKIDISFKDDEEDFI